MSAASMSLRRMSGIAVAALLLFLVLPRSAYADVTLFTGTIGTVGGQEQVVGAAFSWFPAPIEMVRVELEGWSTTGVSGGGHNVGEFGARLLVQWPERRRIRPYVAVGAGLYGETPQGGGGGSGETSGRNIGAGVKTQLKGPLAVRVDYRLFFIDAPDASMNFAMRTHPQLLTAGFAVTF